MGARRPKPAVQALCQVKVDGHTMFYAEELSAEKVLDKLIQFVYPEDTQTKEKKDDGIEEGDKDN